MSGRLGEPWDAEAAYDRMAAARAKVLGAPWPSVGRFLQALPRGALVLDVGVGNGRYFTMQEAAGLRWIGVDLSREQLKLARANLPTASGLARCDARRLPVRAQAADAAVMVATVHHFATSGERVAALREVARVLKPRAPWLVSAWSDTAGFARGATRRPGGGPRDVVIPYHEGLTTPVERFFHLYAEGELAGEAAEAGLSAGKERLELENRFVEGTR